MTEVDTRESSKVVGDMAMFLLTKGVEPKDVANLEPGTAFPESVIDMLSGGLGQPKGGWPKQVQKVVIGDKKASTGRPGASAGNVDLEEVRKQISKKVYGEVSDDDLYSYLMYPDVFDSMIKFINKYGHARALPTPAYFYGLKMGEEISVEIEEGKTLIIKLINIGQPDEDGKCTLTFELNGRARECVILDTSVKATSKRREKADSANKMQVGAPIPAMVSSVNATVGQKVKQGDKLVVLEAMKMQTTVYALADGVIDKLEVQIGDQVDSKDLLVQLR